MSVFHGRFETFSSIERERRDSRVGCVQDETCLFHFRLTTSVSLVSILGNGAIVQRTPSPMSLPSVFSLHHRDIELVSWAKSTCDSPT